jgi:DNA-binding IclR family transcriptional regulator
MKAERSARLVRRQPKQAAPQPATEEEGADTQFIAAVARALQVLDAFRHSDDPMGNSELAERTGLPKPTVSRLTYTLAHGGYLAYDSKRREYELGGGALALGAAALSRRNVRTVALPLMRALADESGFNVGLGTCDHEHRMIYTDACEGFALIGLRLRAGDRIPLLTSAMGRAWLAAAQPETLQSILTTQQGRPEFAAWTKVIDSARRDVQRQGFCISAGDWQQDIHGVAAPIRTGDRVFAINLGGPAYRLPVTRLKAEFGPRIAAIAQSIEAALRGNST